MQSSNQEQRIRTHHFFGELWLEPPEDHLDPDALMRLKELEPLIQDLEGRQSVEKASEYNITKEFTDFETRETGAWRKLGVERPRELLLRPSADIRGPVACHLHNPTFYVRNPYCRETENRTSPTIQQLNQAGFSKENTFIFDHLCRRDRTEDVLLFYDQDIYKVHEEFMLSFRKKMAAKVEICWGKHVRERMKTLVNLVPLKLWGSFQDVELFLEFENQKVVRFLLFVAHPQFFFYHGSYTDNGIHFRRTKARKQDLYLTVASRLGGINFNHGFYENTHRPALYGQFNREHRELVNRLETEAEAQLKVAFPQRYQEIEMASETPEQLMQGPQVTTQSLQSELIRGDSRQEEIRRSRQLTHITQTLLVAAGKVMVNSISLRSLAELQLLSNIASDWDDISGWDEIPSPFRDWIQQQDGLKIEQVPISSTDELKTALNLISSSNDLVYDLTVMQMMLNVALSYISRVSKQRCTSVKSFIIPGVRPYNIMHRKCARCAERVLDDAFACYAKEDPKQYVTWYRLYGCGRPGCRLLTSGKFAYLLPVDPKQGYRVATVRSLRCLRSALWAEYLLCCPTDGMAGLPDKVQTRCKDCKAEIFWDTKPRWTAEEFPRYVIPVRQCHNCTTRYSSFLPTDPKITSITKASLSKKWKDLQRGGVNPTEYPRRPDILWSRKSHLTKRKELEKAVDSAIVGDASSRIQEPKKKNFQS